MTQNSLSERICSPAESTDKKMTYFPNDPAERTISPAASTKIVTAFCEYMVEGNKKRNDRLG